MKKKIFILFTFLFVITNSLFAQLKFVSAYSDYSSPITKRLNVNRINGVGGGIEINFNIYKGASVALNVGYKLYSISQDSALAKWNWQFWNTRYKGIVQADLAANKGLSATLDPVQKMDIIPVAISAKYEYEIFKSITTQVGAAGGVMFFTRRMYLDEHWTKAFANYDYQFSYEYHNFADNKYGNPFFFNLSAGVCWEFTDGFRLDANACYLNVIDKPHTGFGDFPFKNSFDIKLGLTFLY